MNELNDGYNIVYAKSGGSPKNINLKTRLDVVQFFLYNLNHIDFLSINDVVIDKNKLVNDNIKLGRYLKLKKIYEI